MLPVPPPPSDTPWTVTADDVRQTIRAAGGRINLGKLIKFHQGRAIKRPGNTVKALVLARVVRLAADGEINFRSADTDSRITIFWVDNEQEETTP